MNEEGHKEYKYIPFPVNDEWSAKKALPPPATKPINTDSEEDPEYNREEFLRLRTSLQRRVAEGEAKDRAKKKGEKQPCYKLRNFFRNMFEPSRRSSTKGVHPSGESTALRISSTDLGRLKCPSSENQVLGPPPPDSSEELKTKIK